MNDSGNKLYLERKELSFLKIVSFFQSHLCFFKQDDFLECLNMSWTYKGVRFWVQSFS